MITYLHVCLVLGTLGVIGSGTGTPSRHNVQQLANSGRLASAQSVALVRFQSNEDARTPKAIATLKGHEEKVTCVVFSPDGTALASGGTDQAVKVWDIKQLKEINSLKGHKSSIGLISYSPDGKMLASSGSPDVYSITLWTFGKKTQQSSLQGHTSEVLSIAWSPDGKLLASCSSDDTIRIWDTHKGKEVQRLSSEADGSITLVFSPDGSTLFTGGDSRNVVLYDASSWKKRAEYKGHAKRIILLSIADGGMLLASKCIDAVNIWDTRTGKAIKTFRVDNGSRAVRISPNGKWVATGHDDGTLTLWDITTGKARCSFKGHEDVVSGVAFSHDSCLLSSASHDGAVKVWDVKAITEGK